MLKPIFSAPPIDINKLGIIETIVIKNNLFQKRKNNNGNKTISIFNDKIFLLLPNSKICFNSIII